MSIGRLVFGLTGLSSIILATCSWTLAATVGFDPITPPEDFALVELITVDPLGYDCIRERDIDLAFHANGKGVRLPRTCLPDPCEAALSEFELASLIGRAPFQSEWDDYFSRYADYCRKEIVPFDDAPVTADPGGDPAQFWAPLVASYPPTAPIRDRLPPGIGPVFDPDGGPPTGSLPGPGPDPTPPDPDLPFDDPDPRDDPPTGSEPPSPVPLPGGLGLILTALAALLLGRRRGPAT